MAARCTRKRVGHPEVIAELDFEGVGLAVLALGGVVAMEPPRPHDGHGSCDRRVIDWFLQRERLVETHPSTVARAPLPSSRRRA